MDYNQILQNIEDTLNNLSDDDKKYMDEVMSSITVEGDIDADEYIEGLTHVLNLNNIVK